MKISRHYTTPNKSAYAKINFAYQSEIHNPDGSVHFPRVRS